MRYTFLFTCFIISCFTLSCKKEPVLHPDPATSTGELRVTVRLYTSAGQAGSSAVVNVALSEDSLVNKKYISTMNTDAFGYALFQNLSWPKSSKYPVFVNAEQTDGVKLLKGKNTATLIENRTTNVTVVLE